MQRVLRYAVVHVVPDSRKRNAPHSRQLHAARSRAHGGLHGKQSKDAVEKARRGYKEINLRALRLLNPGGCLITCSCSYHVHEEDFEAILASACLTSSTPMPYRFA